MSDSRYVLGLDEQPAHDYPYGPPTRWARPWSSPVVTVLTAVGAALVGFLLVAGMSAGRTSALEQDARKAELISLIHARQEHTDRLSEQLEALRARVAAAEADVAAGTPVLAARLREVEQAAGLTRVVGPGLVVTLDDGPLDCSPQQEECRIQDRDLQLAVNALFAAGAEAIAVNGERVITTTAVRRAGRQLLVNYRVLTPPYVLEAIGQPDRLEREFTESTLGQQFAVWTDVYGLGFSLRVADGLDVPGYTGSVRLDAAQAAGIPNPEPSAP